MIFLQHPVIMSVMVICSCHRDKDNAITLPTDAGLLEILCLNNKHIKSKSGIKKTHHYACS